jgi:hypothetical protein
MQCRPIRQMTSALLAPSPTVLGAQTQRRFVPDLALVTPASVDVAPDRSTIVADFTRPTIYLLIGCDGTLKWSRTSKGSGPGDVLRPYRVAAGDTTVWVYDFTARDFSRFARSRTFMKSLRLSIAMTQVDDFAAIGDSLLVVLGSIRQTARDSAAIHVFTADGGRLRSFSELAVSTDRNKLSQAGTGTLVRTIRNGEKDEPALVATDMRSTVAPVSASRTCTR